MCMEQKARVEIRWIGQVVQRPWFKLIDTATTYANLAKNISFKFHPVSGKSKSKRNRNKFVYKRFLTNKNDN